MPAPVARDLHATAHQLESWLPKVLPDARGLRVDMHGGPSATGFSSDTLLFALSHRDARGAEHREELVARLEPRGYRVFKHYDVAQQFRVMSILAKTDVPVPRMRWLEQDESVLGSPFYVMDRVEGRVPSDNPPYNVGGWLHDELSPVEREQLWWSGLEAMTRVHKLDWKSLGLGFLARPELGADGLAETLNEYEDYFTWGCETDRYPLIRRGLDFLKRAKPAGAEPLAVCWGDSRPANQIYQHTQCVAVIDWEMVHLGNPLHDLAWWVSLDRCFSEGIGLTRLAGLPSRDETAARWSALTGFPIDHLDYYEALSVTQFAVIMARVIGQMKHYGILPADHTMDRDNLASVILATKLAELGA